MKFNKVALSVNTHPDDAGAWNVCFLTGKIGAEHENDLSEFLI